MEIMDDEVITDSILNRLDSHQAAIDNLCNTVKMLQVEIMNLTAMSKGNIDMNVSQQKVNVFCKQKIDGLDKKFSELLRIVAEQQLEACSSTNQRQ